MKKENYIDNILFHPEPFKFNGTERWNKSFG